MRLACTASAASGLAARSFQIRYHEDEGPVSKKEIIVQELEGVPEKDFDTLLGFIQSLKSRNAEDAAPMLLAESSLKKDWLTPEEDAAWADL
jgi:hypothetical protein